MRGLHGAPQKAQNYDVPSLREEADAASKSKASSAVAAQFAALLDSARGAADAGAKKSADKDDEADKIKDADATDDGDGRTKSTSPAVDPRMLGLVLPFPPPAPPPALPTKLSLDAAANGQISKGTSVEPPATGAKTVDGKAILEVAAGATTSTETDRALASAALDPAKVVSGEKGASEGEGSKVTLTSAALSAAAKAAPPAAIAPATVAHESAVEPSKSANGQSAAASSAASGPSTPASAHRTENSSIVRAADLDTFGGSPIAKSAAHAATSNGSGAGAGSGDGKDASKSSDEADAASAATAKGGSTASAADLGVVAATASRDNSLTAANPLAPHAQATANTVPEGATTAERAASAQSAANQMVMRNAAHGEIDHPELGRIGVRADLRDGQVDVRVNAERPEAAAALTAHAVHMASDVRAADIPLSQLHIQDDTSRGSSGNNAFSRGNSGESASDGSSGGGNAGGATDGQSDTNVQTSIIQNAVDAARVRIVL